MDELSLRRDSSFGKSKKDSPLGGGLEAIATCLMIEVGRLRRVGVKKMSIDGSCWVVEGEDPSKSFLVRRRSWRR